MVPFTVLHYIGAEEDRGGILTMVRSLAAADLGRAIVWVAPRFEAKRAPSLRWLRRDGPPSETINPAAVCRAAGVAWRLRRAVQVRKRIFHGHSRAGLLVGVCLKLLGADRVVVSVHCHGRHSWFYRWAALVLGGRMIWLTPAMKRHYDVGARTWQGCQPNFLAAAVSATTERDALSSAKSKESLEIAPRSQTVAPVGLRLGGIGALVAWKGWHLVIEALARLPEAERLSVRFFHLGSVENSDASRTYAARLMERSAELGVADAVVWRGEETSSRALLSEVDVLVVPSIGEPFSFALLEAWRAGVPVLAADDAGPAELLTEGRDGWLFQSGSSSALAEKLSTLVRSRGWKTLRPELPSAEPAVARWRALYAEVLA